MVSATRIFEEAFSSRHRRRRPRPRKDVSCNGFTIISQLLLLASLSSTNAFLPSLSRLVNDCRPDKLNQRISDKRIIYLESKQIRQVYDDQRPSQLSLSMKDALTNGSEEETKRGSLFSSRLVEASDALLNITATPLRSFGERNENSVLTRRLLFASALLTSGAAVAATDDSNSLDLAVATGSSTKKVPIRETSSSLQWQTTPVNKRTGVTVFDAEKAGYNIRFVTYLSRFLLVFDADCQRWWYNRAALLPRLANADEVNNLRLEQFGAFSASVEVGLQEYRGPDGPKTLLRSLLTRYCPSIEDVIANREATDLPPLSETAQQKEEIRIKEARRQIALLFGLMENGQPVEEITRLLAAIDNGSVATVQIKDPGAGYAPGYGPPEVRFPQPDAGPNYETATGRAILTPNGKILRVDLVNRGIGYSKPPVVSISAPAAIRPGMDPEKNSAGATQAEAKAFLFRSGVNRGRIERIALTKPGSGYRKDEIIRIFIDSPDKIPGKVTATATATAILEYEVTAIETVKNGTGYAVGQPIPIYVDSPPLTARVNMNDPLNARIVSANEPLPSTTIPSKKMLKKMPTAEDPTSWIARATSEAQKVGPGRCIGRACYDQPVEAVAYARAVKDSYSNLRPDDTVQTAEKADDGQGASEAVPSRTVGGSSIGAEDITGGKLSPFLGNGPSSSTQLLSLLPPGIGLEFDNDSGRYSIAADPAFKTRLGLANEGSAFRAVDPNFGPRGRSPIEREKELGVATYLRFVASGAICSSGVHLALTPIDVVKTKVQTNPARYPGIISSFQRVVKEEGLDGLFTGWAPTFLGFFIWGGFSYGFVEFVRRFFSQLPFVEGPNLEVPIIVLSAGLSAFFGSFMICPFEAVRIRSVSQPDFGSNIVDVFNRMVDEEGLLSLFSAVPVFFIKEIPFAMAKFTVFDVSTEWLYNEFPAAQEDIQLSFLVTLAGGTLGGIAAAIVSNPADVTISEMKKAKTEMSPGEAAEIVLDRGGPPAFFRGLSLRVIFYILVVSLQFLVYDAVRLALGIGGDDLKLYLDVLGGALQENGGPI